MICPYEPKRMQVAAITQTKAPMRPVRVKVKGIFHNLVNLWSITAVICPAKDIKLIMKP